MSIPLDRLYNFLKSFHLDPTLLIYQFFPHGSKKLENLCRLLPGDADHAYPELEELPLMWSPSMICHDQEPLNYDLYSQEEFVKIAEKKYAGWHISQSVREQMICFEASMHLRGVTETPGNIFDLTLLCHSEKNSVELDKYLANGFLGVYYWSHAVIARDWFRFAQHDRDLIPNLDNITQDFLIYCRAWAGTREYRLKFADLLINRNLVNSARMSMAFTDQNKHYQEHDYVCEQFRPDHKLEDYFQPNMATSCYSADYDSQDYAVCGIEVVLETLFDDARLHLTEKSLRPIACARPFILVANPGSLQYLRDYGFKTFSGLIDESYDQIQDPMQRLHAVVSEMQRIKNLDTESKKLLWAKLYKIANYNQQLFFSETWSKNIIQEYKNNFDSAMHTMKQNRTGLHFKEYCRINPSELWSEAGASVSMIQEKQQRRQKIFKVIDQCCNTTL